ncbi:MAG: 50S ribosomal protein L11 methyltransferase [Anaerolineae bacterium]|nr:50S ribosomal protein L11 methyltransferase [Anaerolineae bacterium]
MDTENWLEISVQVDGEAAEAISEMFNRYGKGGAVIEHLLIDGLGAHDDIDELRIKTYISPDDAAARRKIEEALWHLSQIYPVPEPQFTLLTEADWAEAWKAHYGVLHIGQRTVIVPAWQQYDAQPGEVVLRLDPGMAFGTGTHPTTRLCLEALERAIAPGMRVFDVGTGSGVLAISAIKQGAGGVLAVDVDEIAVNSARKNLDLNDMGERIRLETGSIERGQGKYDLLLVNILAKIIVMLLDQDLAGMLKPGGAVIASGIIDTQEAQVREALESHGIEIVDRLTEKDWVALIGHKKCIVSE